ncbi:MAG: tRNA (adenosine(37)-N6)-threonylcarbamoyltransferase complex ATPase subunit type 1 TsaE [Clostridia bacterium]|nr:tRNA (adenosine(37)-N6)-threonylcarbamoyltransferase complex ATPase subunit type 1 TsaE [Clostridia bacterium]
MTEKTEITNQDLTTKLSEDDFQLVEAGDSVSDAQDAESVEVDEKTTNSETEGEGGKSPVKKSSGKKKGVPTRKLCGMAVLTALAVVLSCTVHIPYFGAAFLEYSPSDVPVLIASFMYGPVWGLVITAIVSLIQGLTVSAGSGWIGIAMNFLSTGIFVLSAGLIYKFKHDIKGATIGLVVGFVCGVVSMILWNILITPLYMNVPRETVLAMIPTVFLPFNVLKYAGNAAMTFSLYKATGKFFKLAFGKVPDKTIDDVDASIDGKHISKSVDDTYDLAKRLADTLEGGEIILLNGDLGAGKTTFSKGLAKALGVEGDVTSPTFTIMNVYEDGRLKLNHLDMYRIVHEDELYELGVEDAMTDDAVTVIEWNKLTFTGKKVISIDIKAEKNKRIFTIKNENTCS